VPRHLLPRDLDSSLEKVQKLVLKPVLYWIVGVDSSFSPTCLAADVPSVVPSSNMVRMVPPRHSCQAVKFQDTICRLRKLRSFVRDVH
jgi:hypothetical protein